MRGGGILKRWHKRPPLTLTLSPQERGEGILERSRRTFRLRCMSLARVRTRARGKN